MCVRKKISKRTPKNSCRPPFYAQKFDSKWLALFSRVVLTRKHTPAFHLIEKNRREDLKSRNKCAKSAIFIWIFSLLDANQKIHKPKLYLNWFFLFGKMRKANSATCKHDRDEDHVHYYAYDVIVGIKVNRERKMETCLPLIRNLPKGRNANNRSNKSDKRYTLYMMEILPSFHRERARFFLLLLSFSFKNAIKTTSECTAQYVGR